MTNQRAYRLHNKKEDLWETQTGWTKNERKGFVFSNPSIAMDHRNNHCSRYSYRDYERSDFEIVEYHMTRVKPEHCYINTEHFNEGK